MKTKPKIQIDIAKVEEAAQFCSNMEEIAAYLGIGSTTLYERQKESEEIGQAIKRGRAKANAWAGSQLMTQIANGNTAALIFYLKCKAGWKEKQVVELSTKTEKEIAQDLSCDDLKAIAKLDENATT